MKKNILLAITLFICVILQETWMYGLRIGNAQPNLVLLFVVFYALFYGWQGGALLGFCAGFFMDLCSGYYIGLTAISFMVTGALIGLFVGEFYEENYFIIALAAALGSLLNAIIYWFCIDLLGNQVPFWQSLFHNFLPNMLYNCVIACIVYVPLLFFYSNKRE